MKGGIEEGGAGAKKPKKQHNDHRREVVNGGEMGCRSKKRRQESVGSVGTNRGYLDSNKGAEREEAFGAKGLHKN